MASQRPAFHTITAGRPLLEIDQLSIEYPSGFGRPPFRAVDDVSLSVWPGESVGLVGESGCGKTSLGRAVVGLAPVSRGTLSLAEPSGISGGRPAVRLARAVQMVFQDPYSSLDARQRILDAVVEPLVVHRIGNAATRSARAVMLLEQVGLDARIANSYPHELSGGQRQRVCIARALAVHPRLLVCDEPTSALDVSIQAQVVAVLQQLQREHELTYFFISHDLALLPQLVSEVAVMYLGRVVEHGPVAEVLHRPAHPYTVALIDAVPELGRRRGVRSGERLVGEISTATSEGCRFRPRCSVYRELDGADQQRCATEVPALPPRPRAGHVIACHHRALPPAATAVAAPTRSAPST